MSPEAIEKREKNFVNGLASQTEEGKSDWLAYELMRQPGQVD